LGREKGEHIAGWESVGRVNARSIGLDGRVSNVLGREKRGSEVVNGPRFVSKESNELDCSDVESMVLGVGGGG